MNDTNTKEYFMKNKVMELLKNLKPETEPAFGLMTPQHMVEHLSSSLKACVKRIGEVENPPSKKQLGFQRFIEKGATLKYYPSEKTKADLPELKFEKWEDAIEQVGVAIERFYTHFEANPDFKCYNNFFGELDFEQLELFNYNHYSYHLWQFGLIEKYPQDA